KNVRGCDYKWIWESKIPLKIQIFLWQLFQDAILTRDVMSRRKWAGNSTCSFCSERETSQHLFFTCPVARIMWRTVGCVLDEEKFYTFGLAAMCWAMWNCHNKATFESK
uniref:Reverse transcriptase zinc-binding domain-containing protein n=1 Tax=Aegilops tauschii subsp. strangulata TaxID=200361 RepID=A0A452ZUF0_AEGTS